MKILKFNVNNKNNIEYIFTTTNDDDDYYYYYATWNNKLL